MGIKTSKGRVQCQVLKKVKPNETFFVLRAQDALAPLVVRLWADLAEKDGLDPDKAFEARQLADKMERWPDRKSPD